MKDKLIPYFTQIKQGLNKTRDFIAANLIYIKKIKVCNFVKCIFCSLIKLICFLIKKMIQYPKTSFMILIIFILLLIMWGELKKDTIIINDFLVPEGFLSENKNINGKILALHLLDNFNWWSFNINAAKNKMLMEDLYMRRSLSMLDSSGSCIAQSFTSDILLNISIYRGISFKDIIDYIKKERSLKKWFKWKYYIIDGDISKYPEEKQWNISIRLKGDINKSYKMNFDDFLSTNTAEMILCDIDPVIISLYYLNKKNYSYINKLMDKEISLRSDNLEQTYYLKGLANYRMEKYNEAIECGLKQLTLNKNNPEIYSLLGTCNFMKGYKYIISNSHINDDSSTATKCLKKARKYYTKAIKISPQNPIYNYNKGLSYFYLKKYERALKYFCIVEDLGFWSEGKSKLLDRIPIININEFNEFKSDIYDFKADCYLHMKSPNIEKAEENCIHGIKYNINSPNLCYTLGKIYFEKGKQIENVKENYGKKYRNYCLALSHFEQYLRFYYKDDKIVIDMKAEKIFNKQGKEITQINEDKTYEELKKIIYDIFKEIENLKK